MEGSHIRKLVKKMTTVLGVIAMVLFAGMVIMAVPGFAGADATFGPLNTLLTGWMQDSLVTLLDYAPLHENHPSGESTTRLEKAMKHERDGINPTAKPTGSGCVECLATDGWWLHLRRCAECGHIGCCDNSPNQHASEHNATTGHPIITSFEPGEDWFYDYRAKESFVGPKLPTPHSHPMDQPVPGPRGRVPSNWQSLLHQ